MRLLRRLFLQTIIFLLPGLLIIQPVSAQNDTLTVKELELLKLFGGIIKHVTGEAIKEGTNSSVQDGLVKGTIRNILKKTTEKSIRQLGVPGGFKNHPRSVIELPSQLKNLESAFQQQGKRKLLDVLSNSVNEAASEALANLAPVIAGKFVESAVDRIISNANVSDSTLTKAFDRMFRNDLRQEILPLVQKGLKVYKTTRTVKKINRFMKKKDLGVFNSDLDQYVTQGVLDGLFSLMQAEELEIRKNPARLIDKIFDLFKNQAP